MMPSPSSLVQLCCQDLHTLNHYPQGLMVACSAGIDSVSLFHALLFLRQKHHPTLKLHLLYIHHHLRPHHAHQEEQFVQALAHRHHLPFHSYHPWPPYALHAQLAAQGKMGPCGSEELWGREIRQQCYHSWIRQGYAMALGHHQQDGSESILFRLIRGSNVWNLHGMQRWHQGVFRPLLTTPKKQILQFAQDHNLTWLEDHSNHNLQWARNRIRHNIVPELQHIQPQSLQALHHTAHHGHDMAQYIRQTFAQKIATTSPPRRLPLQSLPWEQSTVCQLAWEALAGIPLTITSKHRHNILRALKRTSLASSSSTTSSPSSSSSSSSSQPTQRFTLKEGTLVVHKHHLFFCSHPETTSDSSDQTGPAPNPQTPTVHFLPPQTTFTIALHLHTLCIQSLKPQTLFLCPAHPPSLPLHLHHHPGPWPPWVLSSIRALPTPPDLILILQLNHTPQALITPQGLFNHTKPITTTSQPSHHLSLATAHITWTPIRTDL